MSFGIEFLPSVGKVSPSDLIIVYVDSNGVVEKITNYRGVPFVFDDDEYFAPLRWREAGHYSDRADITLLHPPQKGEALPFVRLLDNDLIDGWGGGYASVVDYFGFCLVGKIVSHKDIVFVTMK